MMNRQNVFARDSAPRISLNGNPERKREAMWLRNVSGFSHFFMTKMTDLDNAYAECRHIALGHYENFPVGSLLIPRILRKHFFALYAFMRTADDFADLPHRPNSERLRLLQNWRAQLHSIYDETTPDDPIFLALHETTQKFDLPQTPFDLLLDAFEFDARGEVRFDTYNDLHW